MEPTALIGPTVWAFKLLKEVAKQLRLPRRPATEARKLEAQANLKLVLERLKAAEEHPHPYGAHIILEEAAMALRRASKLDPSQSIKPEERTYTQDFLAGWICYLESFKHFEMVKKLRHDEEDTISVKRELKLARQSGKRSIEFAPEEIAFLQHYAWVCGQKLRWLPSGWAALNQAKKLDPYNIETIRMRRRYWI